MLRKSLRMFDIHDWGNWDIQPFQAGRVVTEKCVWNITPMLKVNALSKPLYWTGIVMSSSSRFGTEHAQRNLLSHQKLSLLNMADWDFLSEVGLLILTGSWYSEIGGLPPTESEGEHKSARYQDQQHTIWVWCKMNSSRVSQQFRSKVKVLCSMTVLSFRSRSLLKQQFDWNSRILMWWVRLT